MEERFAVPVGNVLISGSIDRLEITEDGEVFVVDLKTSKYPISVKDGKDHPQLKIYQLAVIEGEFTHLVDSTTSAGAELFYPASGKNGAQRPQPPINPDEVKKMIDDDGRTVNSHSFVGIENDLCDNCALKSSCPVRPEGRSLR